MFTIYIQYFKNANGTVNNTLTQMFSIPSSNKFPIDKPIVKGSEDAADSFTFKMEANSPYYDALILFKTRIRVEYDGDVIFYGHVMSINTSTLFQTKQVNCSGAYAFMNDTFYEGVPDAQKSKITVSDYLTNIITNHNTMAPNKAISRGNITNPLPSETDRYEPSSWSQTSSLITGLKNEFGGHFRVRYYNGTCYLDWYKYFLRDLGDGNRPSVTIRKNILEFNSNSEVDNMFTRVIPYGASTTNGATVYLDGYKYTDKNGTQHTFSGKAFPVSLIKSLYTDGQLTDEFHSASDYTDPEGSYGVIYKTVSFPDAKTKEKLWDETKKWVKDSYFGLATSFSIKAFDMHIADSTVPKILVGDRVDINYYIYENGSVVLKTKKYVCKSIQYDLFNPENNTYSFGVPSDVLDRTSRKYSKKAASNNIGGSSSSRRRTEEDKDTNLTFDDIAWMIVREQNNDYGLIPARDSFVANGPHSGTVYCYDADEIEGLLPEHTPPAPPAVIQLYANSHREACIQATIVGKITLPGKSTKWVCHSTDPRGGVFAFVDNGFNNNLPKRITYWYQRNSSGTIYQYTAPSTHTVSDTKTMITTEIKKIVVKASEQAQLVIDGQKYDHDPVPLGGLKLDEDGNPILAVFDGTVGSIPAESVAIKGGSDIASITMEAANNGILIDAANKALEMTKKVNNTPKKVVSIRNDGTNGPTIEMADDTNNNYPNTVSILSRTATVKVKDPADPEKKVELDGKNTKLDITAGVKSIIANAASNEIKVTKKVNSTVQPLVKLGDSNDGPVVALHNDTLSNFAKTVAITARTSTIDLNTTSGVKTVEVNGASSKIDLNNTSGVNTVEVSGVNAAVDIGNSLGTKTVKVDGINEKVQVGKNNNDWRCIINDLVTYTDSSGVEHTNVPGFITGEDMKIDTIPSFKTKLAVVDTLIAGKVDAVSINADIGYVRKLNSNTIQANTSVRAANIYGSTIRSTNYYGDNFYLDDGNGGVQANLGACFSSASFSVGTGTNAGKIYLTLNRAHGRSGTDLVINFNIADTAFYQNAVSASWNQGGQTAYFTASRTSDLDPGQSSTMYAYYVNSSGQSARSYVSDTGKYSALTIKARNLRLRTPSAAVTPTTSNQTITPGSDSGGVAYDGLAQVVVAGSSNLTAGNIKSGVSIFGVSGTFSDWNQGGATAYFTASRTADLDPGQSSTMYAYYVNNSGQSARSYASGTGKYSSLTIKARSLRLRTPSAAITPTTSNQTITPGSDSGGTAYDGLAQVVVAGDADLVAGNIKSGVNIFGVTGTYAFSTQSKTVTPTAAGFTVLPDSGKNGLSSVVINGDSDLVAGNIKSGVTIFGVEGTYSGGGSHSITITPDAVGKSSDPGSSYVELWSTTNFVLNRWYVMTVKCGTESKKYKIHVVTSGK